MGLGQYDCGPHTASSASLILKPIVGIRTSIETALLLDQMALFLIRFDFEVIIVHMFCI